MPSTSADAEAVEGVDDAVVDGVHELARGRRTGASRSRAMPRASRSRSSPTRVSSGKRCEERLGVAGHAERGVDEHGARRADGRGEQLDAALEHDGGVDAVDVHESPGGLLSPDPHPST